MYAAQWISGHARIRPQQVAIIDRAAGERITYAQLQRRILARLGQLEALGVKAGERVAVLSGNRVEMLELLFACARLSAIMVPLNWRLTVPELGTILGDCKPALIFAEEGRALPEGVAFEPFTSLPTAGTDERTRLEGAGRSFDLAHALPAPDAPVLILYTGGTTGIPKGALLTHATMQHNALNTISGWGLAPDDVAPVFTPFFHTGGLNVLVTPLFCLGGAIVMPAGHSFDPAEALELIEEEGCTQVFMVPTMFTMLREHKAFDPERLRHVRGFISGGAPCPAALFDFYWSHGLELRQGYGLTEAGPNTFGASFAEARARVGTVGTPLPHVQVRLVDEEGLEVAAGEVGEIAICGPHVMPGYFNRPVETAAVLRDGWLYTGDLARRDADGYVFICGRRKEMFISGGENVFPAEIEEVLASAPGVAEVAVVGVPDPRWGEVGHAWLVAREGARLDAEALRALCHEKLARYKTPKELHIVDALPKSAAGKVLKRELAAQVPALA